VRDTLGAGIAQPDRGHRELSEARLEGRLTVLYDAECPFCTRIAARLAGMDEAGRLRLVPLQQASQDPGLDAGGLPAPGDLAAALHVVDAEGRWASGGEAILRASDRLPRLRPFVRVARSRLFAPFLEPAYRFVADHREWFSAFAGARAHARARAARSASTPPGT
jgi:predicted DCC family thiol-disulfide oxidoreductase YuxK